jgi:hypothetical protein
VAHPEAVDLCRRVNDDVASRIAEHPDRFRGFLTKNTIARSVIARRMKVSSI